MWDEGSVHGVLFLSHRPRRVAARLVPWDVCAAFVDMLRCLVYAHHARAHYRGWADELARAAGVAPCDPDAAARRNRPQCEWTAAAHSNYAWMCLAAEGAVDTYGTVLPAAGRRALVWLAAHVPFPTPDAVTLPTVFPPPGEQAARDTLPAAARAARQYYRARTGEMGK